MEGIGPSEWTAPCFSDEHRLRVLGAENCTIRTEERPLADLNGGGYWSAPLGHRNPEILEAMAGGYWGDLFNFKTGPAESLSARLCEPLGYHRAVYACSGSSAVDAALRIAYQVSASSEQRRTRVLSLRRGYHGSTALTLACGGLSYRSWVTPLQDLAFVFNDERALRRAGGDPDKAIADLPWDEFAAFIYEPIQGVGGLRTIDASLLHALAKRCRAEGVTMIADEITTGLYRCQCLSVATAMGLSPDVLLFGKALTGGEYPLSVALLSARIWRGVEESTTTRRDRYLWGETYACHPTGALAALKALDLMEASPLRENMDRIHRLLLERTQRLSTLKVVSKAIVPPNMLAAGVKLRPSSEGRPIVDRMVERGFRLGFEGDTVLLVPMYNERLETLNAAFDALEEELSNLRKTFLSKETDDR